MNKVKLHKTQYDVAKDTHRFRIVCAGRRWGKSVLSQLITLQWAVRNAGLYWIVSPTYRQGKQIHWRGLQHMIPQKWIAKKNEVELSITLKNGSIIELKGAENPDALRGVKLKGIVIDEIASIRNWDWLWEEVLRPTLTDYVSPAIFISTPKGFNHFYTLYEKGNKGEEDYKSWRFTSYDNPYIKKEEIDHAKKEITEDTFAQEYLADFRKHTGLVYKEFQREIHVIEPFDIPEGWTIYRGFDWGDTNPTVCLWIAVDNDDNWFIVDEHYEPLSGKGFDYLAGVINANSFSKRVSQSWADPSSPTNIAELNLKGVYITKANKEIGTNFNSWIRFGIEKVSERLKLMPEHIVASLLSQKHNESGNRYESMPSLFIFRNCTNLIREFETYRWKEKSVTQAQDLNEPDVPEKANDHAMDALRYFAVSYTKPEPPYVAPPSDISNKNWSLR